MEDQHLTGKALGNQYALHALRERRAEMSGEIIELERRLRYLKDAQKHLDATIGLMVPGFDPTSIRPKKPYRKVKLFGAGKLNMMILDALRRAERPLSLAEVTQAVGEAAKFGPDATAGLKGRVRSNLVYLTSVRGSVVKEGERENACWKLAG